MQNWLASHDGEEDAMAAPSCCPSSSENGSRLGSRRIFGDITTNRLWTFRVLMNQELAANEQLAIVGNCEALGNWKHSGAALLSKDDEDDEDSNLWTGEVYIPRHCDTEYRYMVCALDPSAEQLMVRRWETQLQPRVIKELDEQPAKSHMDIFGSINGQEKVDRGWLTKETLVQLKFFYAPFTFKQRMKRRHIQVKVTPMNLSIPSASCESMAPVSPLEDSLSNDTHDTKENGGESSTAFAFSEVVTLSADECEIRRQEQFGTGCGPSDLVIFHLTVGDFENTAYLIDLYSYSSRVAKEDGPPNHLGYHYVLPNLFKRSEGNLELPITCAKGHRPLGMMRLGYLIVKPSSQCALMDMSVSYARYWNNKWTGLDVGHRGSGTSFKAKDAVIRENTITSLKNAADHGADMVEFDVQLSKDLVPVVYHDFMIYVSLKSKCSMQEHDFLALPMRELSLEQLRKLKVYHIAEGLSRETRSFHNDDLLEHQPFPELSDVLDALDVHVGFNIEIKWSQRLEDGKMEEEFEHVVDRNLYIDCILDVILRKAGNRRIVLSCFDPDICTILRFKQNRYPVMFLTLGRTTKYQKYLDPRGNSMELAVWHAVAMEFLGVVAHTEDLLRDPSQVNLAKERGLVLFCWGDDNNSKDTIKLLKELGLHAIIYDKMDVLTTKEVKQSVFHLQAKDSQKELLKLQALEMGHVWHTSADGNEEQQA
ncbi:glycerophosphocholine phosphodiesterase GPCPD1 isoform X1 [Drosophila suzukii]|uniref:Glycerophosphocholine phosphodiesterase GPCPD1 isoform X1 n=2 Tax=Drosophila suzukii TaxID=28584 RepID=A0AB39ZYG8_DROSZ